MIRQDSEYKRAAAWIIPALILSVPLCLVTSLYDTYDLPKLALVELADLLLAALWMKEVLTSGNLSLRRSPLDIPVLAFLAAAAVSTVFSIDRSLSLWGSYRTYIFGWIPMACFALLYWLTLQASGPVLLRRVRAAALLSAACVGLYAVMQYYGLEIIPGIPSAQGDRVWSSLGNPVYVGALCMMALPLAFTSWSAKSGIAFVAILGGLLMSLSRSAWIGAVASTALVAYIFRARGRGRGPILAGVAAFIVMACLIPGVAGRVKSMVSIRDNSNASRLEGWKSGLRIWASHPLFGTGPDTFFQSFRAFRTPEYVRITGPSVTQGHAHNEVIQIASTGGTLGLLGYLWMLVVFLRRWRDPQVLTDREKAGFGAALLALWVQDQFNFSAVSTSAWAAVFAGLFFSSENAEIRTFRLPVNRMAGRLMAAVLVMAGLWAISIPVRADWNFKQGRAWSQGGQNNAALSYFREAVRLNGRLEMYESDQANAARTLGLWDEAWASAQSQVRRHPYNPDAWNNLGVAAMWMTQLAGQNRWQDALSAFNRALELDPVFVDAWANVAKYRHLQGQLEEEKKAWRRVLELDPQHEMARQVLKVP